MNDPTVQSVSWCHAAAGGRVPVLQEYLHVLCLFCLSDSTECKANRASPCVLERFVSNHGDSPPPNKLKNLSAMKSTIPLIIVTLIYTTQHERVRCGGLRTEGRMLCTLQSPLRQMCICDIGLVSVQFPLISALCCEVEKLTLV